MFKTLKTLLKFGSISTKWLNATRVNPGDNGQVASLATQYVNNLGFEPEDAWLTALVNWMTGMPWPESQQMVARGMLTFLNQNEGKIALSSHVIIAARFAAEEILAETNESFRQPVERESRAAIAVSGTRTTSSDRSIRTITKPKAKAWILNQASGQLIHRSSGKVFEKGSYHRDDSSSIVGYVVKDNNYPWASDMDIEKIG